MTPNLWAHEEASSAEQGGGDLAIVAPREDAEFSAVSGWRGSKTWRRASAFLVVACTAAVLCWTVALARHGDAQPSHLASLSNIVALRPACSPIRPTPQPLRGKKGAAFTMRAEGQPGSWVENLPKLLLLIPYWSHSWGLTLIDAQPGTVEFLPMAWGGNTPANLQQSLQQVFPHIASGKVKHLLGFNEPDSAEQANMRVSVALDLWPLMESANVSLVSPSCVQPTGDWMTSFIANATQTCKRVDWIGVHWYGGANFASFTSRMTEVYKTYGRPLLITEFAVADWTATTVGNNRYSRASVLSFMKEALPWLEAQSFIAGYAWFSFDVTTPQGTSSALFNDKGNLTAAGRFYASVRNSRPRGNRGIVSD